MSVAPKLTGCVFLALVLFTGCGYESETRGEQTITKQRIGELRYLATMNSIGDDVGSGGYCGEDLARRCGVLAMSSCMLLAEFGWAQFIPSMSGIFNRYVDPNTVIPSQEDTGETVGQWMSGVLSYWLDPSHELTDLLNEMSNYCGAVLTSIDGSMAYAACVTHGCSRGDCTGGIPILDGAGTTDLSCQEFKDLSDPNCEDYFDPSQCEETRDLMSEPDYIPPREEGGGTGGPGGTGGGGGDYGGYDPGAGYGGPSGGGGGSGGYSCYAVVQVWEICTYAGGHLIGCYQDEILIGIECYAVY